MLERQTLLITGGAGFIGSALVRQLIAQTAYRVVVIDKLGYAGHLSSLKAVTDNPRFCLEQLDITDKPGMAAVFHRHQPDAVLHLAAETHVDRSIDDPRPFIESNIVGTFTLLEVTRHYLKTRSKPERFRLLHVSTDEVYGALAGAGRFSETSPYDPRSPYAASKAASDHLARAYFHTYGLPLLVTNCTNNYGPFQFPEKLIPLTILKALSGEPIPLYGRGDNVRDWLFVDDHLRALLLVLDQGKVGETYAISSGDERQNLEIVTMICDLLNELKPSPRDYRELITFVPDRPGHDRRYALDSQKLRETLGWRPQVSLIDGLRQTVSWYLTNLEWCASVLEGRYALERLGQL
jgi:dTDP-glucose 4,6-dehydratase